MLLTGLVILTYLNHEFLKKKESMKTITQVIETKLVSTATYLHTSKSWRFNNGCVNFGVYCNQIKRRLTIILTQSTLCVHNKNKTQINVDN